MNDRTYFRRIVFKRSGNENISHHSDSMRCARPTPGSAAASLHNGRIPRIKNSFYLCLYLCVHVYLPHVYVCLWRLEEDADPQEL